MALDDDATMVPAVGHYFFNPTKNSPRPTSALAPAGTWMDLGHTSLDSPFGISSDGGDTTTLGTWQNKALRNSHAPRVESIAFVLQQWDIASLKLYYGSNSAVVGGRLRVPESAAETEGSLFVRVDDGAESLAFYWPAVSIYRADDIAFDAEALAGLPVRATILGTSGQDWMYEIDPKTNLGVTSIVVAPTTSSKAAGQTTQVTVTATLTGGGTMDATSQAAYSSSDPTKVTVSQTGLISFVASGSATVTCTYGEQTATVAVTVT